MGLHLRKLIKRNKWNKKTSFVDFTGLFFALAVIFGIAIFFVILGYTYTQIKPKLNEGLTDYKSAEAGKNVTQILDKTDTSITRFNIYFPLLLVGIFAFVMIMALMGRSHPAFLFIGFIVLGVALILAAVYSNVYDEITSTDNFADTESNFNIMSKFVDNLPLIILILFVAIGIILYAKSGGSQGM